MCLNVHQIFYPMARNALCMYIYNCVPIYPKLKWSNDVVTCSKPHYQQGCDHCILYSDEMLYSELFSLNQTVVRLGWLEGREDSYAVCSTPISL